MEKQDLRQQLRRSFDANAPNQKPSQNGRDPIIQHRPHSSHKLSNQLMKPSIGSATNNQIQSLLNSIPTSTTQNDRYLQNDSLPPKDGTQERQKRKRDFSKVIDIAHKALNTS